MDVVIEEAVPYAESVLWRAHEAYYPARGAEAWTSREVPSLATCNFPFARDQALLLLKVVRGLESDGALSPGEEVSLLEIGSGSGHFAALLFRALERGTGPAGRALAPRLRYVLSDFSEPTLRAAAGSPRLAGRVASGAVIPALFDVRTPDALTGLDGRPLERAFTLAVASYVCCATRVHTLRKEAGRFREKWVRARVDLPEGADPALAARMLGAAGTIPLRDVALDVTWRDVDLAARLEPLQAAAVRDVTAGLTDATLHVPWMFLDMLRALAPRMKRGGVALVHDYGTGDREDLTGRGDGAPAVIYGGTINHDVSFPLLEAFARRAGLDVVRTGRSIRALHSAALRYGGPIDPALRRLFRRLTRASRGEELVDLCAAASLYMSDGRARNAAKLFERALRIDPRSTIALYLMGEACLEAGLLAAARRAARRGMRLDEEREHRFDLLLDGIEERMKR